MKKFKLILCVFLFLPIIACKKDKMPVPGVEFVCEPCAELPPLNEDTYGYQYNYVNYITSPEFNPNNDNEIIYIEDNNKIWKLDLISKEKTLLYTGNSLYYGLTWSKKDWIIFHMGLNGLYRMRGNGDSLAPISCPASIHHPKWNWEGTKFTAYRAFGSGVYKSFVFNDDYEIIDTLIGVYNMSGSWNHPDYLAHVDGTKIKMLNVETKKIEYEIQGTVPWNIGGFAWGKENNIIYSNYEGTFIHDFKTNQRRKIRCNCSSIIYTKGTTNRSRTKIIFDKTILTPVNPGSENLNSETKLVLFDIDGTNEVEIEIPE